MKTFRLTSLFLGLASVVFTQPGSPLTLTEAYRQAEMSHPFTLRTPLLEEAGALRLERLDADRLPGISLQAGGRLQSETVGLPFDIPGQAPIELPLISAQLTVDGQYTLYDGGLTDARRRVEEASLLAGRQEVRVDLYQLRQRVNRAFFAVLLVRAREQVLLSSLENLQARLRQAEAGVRHGAVLPGDVDKLRVEALRLEAQIDQARGDQRGAMGTLGALLGVDLPADTHLELPPLDDFELAPQRLDRPELQLFELQKDRILASEALVAAARRPQAGAYAQAGLGYPNPLNFFDDNISPFGIVGLRLSWKIIDWNAASLDRQLLAVQSRLVDNQRAAFERGINQQEPRFREEIATLERLLRHDEAIVALQEQILRQTSAQLDQGVITPAEYLDQVTASTQARLNRETHRLQLRQVKVEYLTEKGGQF